MDAARGELGLFRTIVAITVMSFGPHAAPAAAQQGPPPAVRESVDAVVAYVTGPDPAPPAALLERVADGYRASFASAQAFADHLVGLRAAVGGEAGDIAVERDDEGLVLHIEGRGVANIRMVIDEDTGRIGRLDLIDVETRPGGGPDADPAGRALEGRVGALLHLASEDGATEAFLASAMTPELVATRSREAWLALLARVGRIAAAAQTVDAVPDGSGLRVTLRAGGTVAEVRMAVEPSPPYRVASLAVDTAAATPEPSGPPITWASLEDRLRTTEGFSGAVLAIRDGEVVLHRGFGMANRALGIPNTTSTVFDIGSIPIDFTRAAVLLLVQEGRIDLDHSIDRYLPDVPEDKRPITIRHLLEGRSGLQNFHDLAEDDDADLTPIDRETAERRILAERLLFAPGGDNSPSHSAFGLLAAIVERVSHTTYAAFLERRFFAPAGMRRTGFYGDDLGLPAGHFAVGYGGTQVGDPNIPPNWGPASWLVVGSGGMVSTVDDLNRWFTFVRSGRVLHGDALAAYLERGSALGGTDRGFWSVHAWAGGDNMVFVTSNSGLRNPEVGALPRVIIDLVRGDGVVR